MDPQKSAAHRVRHILQAMERSIDTARSRRVGHAPTSDSPATSERGTTHGYDAMRLNQPAIPASSPASNAIPTPAATARQVMIGAPAPAAPTHAPVTRPGGPQLNGDGQPPRLKAKPKRFDGSVNSAFAPPPAYRSQAG
jgi:hypothetical protein